MKISTPFRLLWLQLVVCAQSYSLSSIGHQSISFTSYVPSRLFGTITSIEPVATTSENICKYCGAQFDSRNAVFRHLRSSSDCYNRATRTGNGNNNALPSILLNKHKVAVQFGYHVLDPQEDDSIPRNELTADLIRKAFHDAFKILYPSSPLELGNSITQSSAAILRHPALSQDQTCSAWSDVVAINYKSGPIDTEAFDLVVQMNRLLSDSSRNNATNANTAGLIIRVLGVESLPVSTKFHAEQSCSQRAYQYLVPLEWLEDNQEAQEWVRQKVLLGNNNAEGHQTRSRDTPTALLTFKEALKCAESRDASHISSSSSSVSFSASVVSSPGRFGSLWQKERRAWHNFCDPSLKGMASPSNEPVWRTIDRARSSGFITSNNDGEQTALTVVEVRGDGFVTGQVRRIVASAVAIANGWLPSNFFDVATRPDICIETPVAPPGRLYFGSARFHFIELVRGSNLFEKTGNGEQQQEDTAAAAAQEWLDCLQSGLLHQRTMYRKQEAEWLDELKNVVAPRIRSQLDKIASDDKLREKKPLQQQPGLHNEIRLKDQSYSEAPTLYQDTLSLLRDVSTSQKWPSTSGARSRVIRSPGRVNTRADDISSEEKQALSINTGATSSKFLGQLSQCGSFTVVNPDLSNGKLPLGNHLFPDLVESIFDLEAELTTASGLPTTDGMERIDGTNNNTRSPSTHCAVNRNAEFTPHVDSGRGQGQSFSMIVGLGDYTRGGLVIEGKSYDVRYTPLEFDGWKQIHSTEPFEGERFSLIWFTPEWREQIASSYETQPRDTSQGETNREDRKASALVREHSAFLPLYPMLKYRRNSTDALVINEILDFDKGCAYELSHKAWYNSEPAGTTESHNFLFSLKNHKCVLDIGAHIGVFTQYALSVGCLRVIAYEPEPNNLELLRHNLKCSDCEGSQSIQNQEVEIHDSAVSIGDTGIKNLVHARNRNDGTLNTWRHSLEEYSQYFDKTAAQLPSKAQEAILTRTPVRTVPLFGKDGALKPGVTFVKLDCEGAEIDLLLAPESSQSNSWLDVTNLVFEWSFTKERRIERFHQAVTNLEAARFQVVYEGQGSWWDTQQDCMWPYHNDLVVFALR